MTVCGSRSRGIPQPEGEAAPQGIRGEIKGRSLPYLPCLFSANRLF